MVRHRLADALAALEDPRVLEAVAAEALEMPQIRWEPVAVAAYALYVWQRLYGPDAAGKTALKEVVILPPETPASQSDWGRSFPAPPLFM